MAAKTVLNLYFLLSFCILIATGSVNASVLKIKPPIKLDTRSAVIRPFFIKPAPLYISRGQMLYENHCTACHQKQLYLRANRKAKNIQQIKIWIIHHSRHYHLDWRNEEINAVTLYLSEHYYRYSIK